MRLNNFFAIVGVALALLFFAMPAVNADSQCYSEGAASVLHLGDCIETENGYKIVLTGISGALSTQPQPSVSLSLDPLAALSILCPSPCYPPIRTVTFKVYDPLNNLVEEVQLYAPPRTSYKTLYGFSIDVQKVYVGTNQTSYAEVYVGTWAQYRDSMRIDDSVSLSGVSVKLVDIGGYPTAGLFHYYVPVTFEAFDSNGTLIKQFVLQRGRKTEETINGVTTHLLYFAPVPFPSYKLAVGFKVGNATTSTSPTPTPFCTSDVYRRLHARHIGSVYAQVNLLEV